MMYIITLSSHSRMLGHLLSRSIFLSFGLVTCKGPQTTHGWHAYLRFVAVPCLVLWVCITACW